MDRLHLTSATRQRRWQKLLVALPLLALTLWAKAQDAPWPNRPIKLIVPYAAGGFADTRARKIADKLSQGLGQPVVIENKGGAGGVIGTDAIAKATDEHTFGFGSPGPLVINPMLIQKMPYDARRDLRSVILIEQAPLILTTAPNQPFKTVGELVAYAKTHPGALSYGSSGIGGAHHLSGEMLAFQTQTQLVHVPYKGGAAAASDLMGGHLAFMFEMGYAALPAIQGNKVRALAVSSRQRLKVLPDVPTLDESGIKGFESYNWLGMIAPAQTPTAVVQRLNALMNDILKDPDVRASIENTGSIVIGGTPQAYDQFLDAERKRWAPVLRNAHITLD